MRDRVALTYDMNVLQSLDAPVRFLVTLNRTADIDPAKVLKTITYHHPVYLPAGVAAQKRRADISGVNRTFYCGAYWRYGFHEDGVVSAEWALEDFARARAQLRTLNPTGLAARRRTRMKSALYSGWIQHRRFGPAGTASAIASS